MSTLMLAPTLDYTLAELPSVNLEQLNDAASLLSRVDRKYVIPVAQLNTISELIPQHACALEIDGQRRFGYVTTYYDTADLLSYRMSAHGQRRRFKVRSRRYESGERWIEVKTRAGRGRTDKDRLLTDGYPAEWVTRTLHRRGLNLDGNQFLPGLRVRFNRSTLLLPDDEQAARLTIDTDLCWELLGYTWKTSSIAIVETKTEGPLSSFDVAMFSTGHRPDRISKYATGLAWLRRELGANRWHRTLSRYFLTEGLTEDSDITAEQLSAEAA
ncbi:MAG: VTC domain-containing protein [Propionibacteriaceae bacterium]|jgi:hypothetical protein|nr:VTC domain-containing protein [Propionibacteriaceae bacterium]